MESGNINNCHENSSVNQASGTSKKKYTFVDFSKKGFGRISDMSDNIVSHNAVAARGNICAVVNHENLVPPPQNTSAANEPEVRKRFVKVTEDNISAIKERRFEKNTALNTNWGVKIFQDWLRENDINLEFPSMSPSDLDELLARFYVEVRKVDGSFYSKPSYTCLRAAIQRYIQNPPFT